jgi:hypothetical protein
LLATEIAKYEQSACDPAAFDFKDLIDGAAKFVGPLDRDGQAHRTPITDWSGPDHRS